MSGLTIIYTYRDRDDLRVKLSFDSLARQTNSNFNVIFIDYGSSPAYTSRIRKLAENYRFVKYIYNNTRYRPWNRSHALNCGIRASQDDFIFTADVDIVFREDFVEKCHKMADVTKAIFFSVYYLPKGYDTSKIIIDSHIEKSKTNAHGLALFGRQAAININGYDEFFCFWGKEDNDIEYRLRKSNIETEFYDDEVLMYHIYHDPVHMQKSLIPAYWIAFQESYGKANRKKIVRNEGMNWGSVNASDSRQCISILEDPDFEYHAVEGRTDFFRYSLESDFMNAPSGAIVAIHFTNSISPDFEGSFIYKVISQINKLILRCRIPFEINTIYSKNYDDIYNARDEVAQFVAVYRSQIRDYGYTIYANEIKVVLEKI